jgi:hypothetical protein
MSGVLRIFPLLLPRVVRMMTGWPGLVLLDLLPHPVPGARLVLAFEEHPVEATSRSAG